jgi:putative endonuclease
MDVDLDPNRAGEDPVEGERLRRGEHGNDAMEANPSCGAQLLAGSGSLCHVIRATSETGAIPGLSSAGMTVQRQRIGRLAERLVAARLAASGWKILERNARTRFGELDIVALEGRTLVFVEVKAGRDGSSFGPERPILSIDHRKQRQVRRLAAAWMAERRDLPGYDEIRCDAVGVTFDRAGRAIDLEHIEGAF